MRRDLVATIPAFNCAPTIGRVVAGCLEHVGAVIVVDDGSSDGTAEAAQAAGARLERLATNQGKGAALRRGLELALAGSPAAPSAPEAIVLLDGDGQHAPADLPGLIGAWEAGKGELIIGSRLRDSECIPRARYFTNYIGSRILTWMSGVELEDSQSGYRLLSARLARRLRLSSCGYAIESEMLLKAAALGARIGHVPIATIYDGAPSHFQPIRDTLRICWAAVYFKVFDEA